VAAFPDLVMDTSALREPQPPLALPLTPRQLQLPRPPASAAPPAPRPVWASLPPPTPFTGNPRGTDAWIIGANSFNLAASAFVVAGAGAAGAALTTVLGPGPLSTASWVLGWIPLAFSALLFAIPVLRIPIWKGKKEKQAQLEARAAVIRLLMEGAERGAAPALSLELVQARHPGLEAGRLQRALERLSSEFGADVEPGAGGELVHHFRSLPRMLEESSMVRQGLDLGRRRLGEIIYSSDDDEAESGRRDLRRFDLDLGKGREEGEA
jgi:hypothetical protein